MFSLFDWGMCKTDQNMLSDNLGFRVDRSNYGALDVSAAGLAATPKKRKRGDGDGPLSSNGRAKLGKMLPALSHALSAKDARPSPPLDTARQQYPSPLAYGALVQPFEYPYAMEQKKGGGHLGPAAPPSPPSTIPEQTNGNATEQLPPVTDAATLTSLQQTIEAQFGLEILLKHRELRLIDQEMAKCQVALEQLRRCEMMPYPATSSKIEDMVAVSRGVGLAYQVGNGEKEAEQPPPWGVVDGPYSRHYSKWLIPDPTFDGGVVEEPAGRPLGPPFSDRATRGGKGERSATLNAGRGVRGGGAPRLQFLSTGHPEPKEEKGPMILKRSTDGKMVKLVCLDCRRENFNSAQGFINHCRIAHGRGFQSHDAAARACGEEVEYNEAGAVVSDPAAVASTDTAGLVHPLIRSDGLADVGQVLTMARFSKKKTNTKANAPNRTADAPPVNQQGGFVATKPQSRPNEHMPRDGRPRTPFVPSPSTPHLSTLFTNAGRGGDLDGFVREAKTKSDLDSILSDDEDDPEGPEMDRAGLLAASGRGASGIEMRGARLPAHTVLSPTPMTRPLSSKGPDRSRAHKPEFLNRILPHSSLASLATSRSHNGEMVSTPTEHNTTMVLANPTPHDLSPVTTETHPAPSLVSDDDDDDYGDPHSDSDTHSSDADDDVDDDRYVEVEVQYEAEVGGPSVDPELRTSGKARAHGARTSQNGGVLGGEGIIRATERRQGGRRERRGKRGA